MCTASKFYMRCNISRIKIYRMLEISYLGLNRRQTARGSSVNRAWTLQHRVTAALLTATVAL